MASRGRRGGVPAREGEQRRDEQTEQQAPAPQGPVLPPLPPVDYGVFMQGLVQAMQTQAHTQAALQAQLEAQERADVWWASLLRTRFEDGAIEIAWDEFVRLFRAKFVPEHIQDWIEQEFLSLTQGSMTVVDMGGYGRRKTRPLRRVVSWLTGCLVEDKVATEGWSSPGGCKMMGVVVAMANGGGMETGGAR
ncbi:hypothetical protein Taro_029386, partial [Colocasia esculenta]|nr:hypothetical protein [Colocasia esculenta]